MSIKVYNILTKRKEEFVPITQGEAKIYVCGNAAEKIVLF